MLYVTRLNDEELLAFLDGLILTPDARRALGTFMVSGEDVLFFEPGHFTNTECADCEEQYYDDGEPGMATCPNCGGCDRA